MFLMNKWFELPYAQEARTWHISKLWLSRSAFTPRNISWVRHDVAGRPSAQDTRLPPQSREGKKNSQPILKQVNAFVGESLVPMSSVIGHTALGYN